MDAAGRRLRAATGRWRLTVFAATAFEGGIAPSDEVAGWRWVRPEALGELGTTAGLAEVIEMAFALFPRS